MLILGKQSSYLIWLWFSHHEVVVGLANDEVIIRNHRRLYLITMKW